MYDISIIIPTYNEEKVLNKNLNKIFKIISKKYTNRCKFIIVDSNSTDDTAKISKEFVKKHKDFSYINLNYDGKGAKIRHMASECTTQYTGWIDSDIPLKLDEYCKLIDEVINKNADLAISSRYAKGAKINRRLTRLIFSKIYHKIVELLFLIDATDTSSGAKFWNFKITKNVWPIVKGNKWFFDTELVYYCIKKGYKLVEVPVTFKDREDSRFSILKDSWKVGTEMLKFRLRTLFSK